jgi:sec-independent protein translocase protein TatB
MFDIGFSELVVIGIVALVVLGPERLPRVARTTGHLLGRLQRYVADVKSDISREMQLDELKKLQEEARQAALSMETSMRSETHKLESEVHQLADEVHSAVSAPASTAHDLSSTHDAAAGHDAAAPGLAENAEPDPQIGLDFGDAPPLPPGKSIQS